MTPPATLDGGDILQVGRTLYVGKSGRTNREGIEQLQRLLAPFDYRVVPVELAGCLHLKSAVTRVTADLVLLNPDWVRPSSFRALEILPIDPREPHAANALRVGETVVYPANFPRTCERLRERGLAVAPIDCSELAKAEGAVTCCSLVFAA
jgi:dimethylargininase